MEDINSIALVGRLTSDPEARSLQSGQTLCSLRLAYNTSEKTGDGWKDKGNFVNVTVWGAHGETCAKFLTKGSRIALKGRLSWREWGDEGARRSETSITADRVQFLDPPKEGSTPVASQPSHPANAPSGVDDDIPF